MGSDQDDEINDLDMGSITVSESFDTRFQQQSIEPAAGALGAFLSTCDDPETFEGPVFPYWDVQPDCLKAFWRMQKAAVKEINRCVDRGSETVDLSSVLSRISWKSILIGQQRFQVVEGARIYTQTPGAPLSAARHLARCQVADVRVFRTQSAALSGQQLALSTTRPAFPAADSYRAEFASQQLD